MIERSFRYPLNIQYVESMVENWEPKSHPLPVAPWIPLAPTKLMEVLVYYVSRTE